MRSLIYWVIALTVFASVSAAEDASAALTDKTEQQQRGEAKAQFYQLDEEEGEAKKIRTKIQTITQCRSFDIEGDGCRNPISAYPASVRHIEYDWESRYTITWDKVNDDYDQIFGWKTDYCGSVNKTLEKGQRSFTFYFKELAKELPCNFTMKQIQMMANAQANALRVEQPDKPGQGHTRVSVGPFPILDELTISTLYWRVGDAEPYHARLDGLFGISRKRQKKPLCERGMNVYTVGVSLVAVAATSFMAGRYFSNRPGQVMLQ